MRTCVDPDRMLHDVAFHLSLHFLLKYPLRDFQYTKGLTHRL